MAKRFSVHIDGMESYRALYGNSRDVIITALQVAITAEIQLAFRQSQREVPVDTGTLKNSGRTTDAVENGGIVEASITYGGAASKYARIQNDDRSLHHPGGGKAGFATDPIMLRGNEIAAGIKERVEKALKK